MRKNVRLNMKMLNVNMIKMVVPMKNLMKLSIFLVFSTINLNCNPQYANAFLQGFSNGIAQQNNIKLMIFGGMNNESYLGCLSCSEYATDSILNEYGTYGSKYSINSIWNAYGNFGSKYSQYSPWNLYATNPPVIVDSDGNFYGYFTINKYFPQRTQIKSIQNFLDLVAKNM